MINKLLALLLITFFACNLLHAQEDSLGAYTSKAYGLYNKKDYCNALYWYEKCFTIRKVNYSLYQASVCACQCGQPEKALQYFKEFMEHGGDFYNYEFFANDTATSCIRNTDTWKNSIASLKVKYDSVQAEFKRFQAAINDTTRRINHSLLTDTTYWQQQATQKKLPALLQSIRSFNSYPKPPVTDHWTLYHIKVNDTLNVPFLVYIPRKYDPTKKTPLYLYLHGAAGNRQAFSTEGNTPEFEKEVLKEQLQQQAFVIYAFARKDINWLYHQQAFETLIKEISFVKSLYNIDDNKVYVSGHSDGGRGTFWLTLNKPTTFAAALGICYYPGLINFNTPLGNLGNQVPFYGISATDDGIFKNTTVNEIYQYALQNGANWKNYTITGGHGLPYSSPDSLHFIYDTLQHRTRSPFPAAIQWQTDNIANGRYYWISIDVLDTAAQPASWQPVLNPPVTKDGKTVKANYNVRRSGFIKAAIKNNIVNIEASCVKQLSFYVYPEMVDLNKPVQFYINNKLVSTKKINPDKNLLVQEFISTKDRQLLPVAKIILPVEL
ncbi:MAG: alpha/beta hydrolase-fold protein [Chitinophagaceae bacterium]